MSENDLHLPSLAIKMFRGIQDLSIERLGRVTLIAGKNGVGKTTLLDAVRVYAARAQTSVLLEVLSEGEELKRYVDEDEDEVLVPDLDAIYYGRQASSYIPIEIGPTGGDGCLSIECRMIREEEEGFWNAQLRGELPGGDIRILKIGLADIQREMLLTISRGMWRQKERDSYPDLPPVIWCESMGPGVLTNIAIARYWDNVVLTDDEDRAVQALRLVFGDSVERVAVMGDEGNSRYGRRAAVKLAGQKRPVPLRSLGDGAVRLFGVALALANSQGGFLLIDEAENGIHYSLQRDFWRMVLLTAEANNVQVFATTHSWDCAAGFARAAVDVEGVEGALVRLERDGENTRAVTYPEEELHAAADHGIEVR